MDLEEEEEKVDSEVVEEEKVVDLEEEEEKVEDLEEEEEEDVVDFLIIV